MKLLFSLPGGLEWILVAIVAIIGCILLITPVLAIYYYSKSRRLMRELENIKGEKEALLAKVLEKTG